jgi:hypothetical protein
MLRRRKAQSNVAELLGAEAGRGPYRIEAIGTGYNVPDVTLDVYKADPTAFFNGQSVRFNRIADNFALTDISVGSAKYNVNIQAHHRFYMETFEVRMIDNEPRTEYDVYDRYGEHVAGLSDEHQLIPTPLPLK